MNEISMVKKQLKDEKKRKNPKGKKEPEVNVTKQEVKLPDTCDLTVHTDKDGDLVVRKNRNTFPIANAKDLNVRENETWTFMFYPYGGGFAAVASKKVSDAPADRPKPAEPKEPKGKNPQKSNDLARLEKELKDLRSACSRLENELKDERSKNKRLVNDNNRLRDENAKIEELRKKVREDKRTIEGLKANVSGLEKKLQPPQDVAHLMKERDEFKALFEAQVEENRSISESAAQIIRIFEERAKGAYVNNDATLLGQSRIHCVLFKEDRYRVYMAPRKGILRFIPDENGNIECIDRFVMVPQMGRYLTDCSAHVLPTTEEDGEIVIRIGQSE